MRQLELLAPARDFQIGIAAIDCGADAVYIAGPQFGARQAAGNDIEDIRRLCGYAHRFGAKIFITLNTILYDSELEDAYRFMLEVQEAGADAIIVQDMAVVEMARRGIGNHREDIRIPLHASTQLSCHTPEGVRFLRDVGFTRVVLAREMSREEIAAAILDGYMKDVVKSGTGTRAKVSGLTIAGKTGSAEGNEDGHYLTHAWFVGYIDDPAYPYAVCVFVEKGESGGSAAAPIAGEIFRWLTEK